MDTSSDWMVASALIGVIALITFLRTFRSERFPRVCGIALLVAILAGIAFLASGWQYGLDHEWYYINNGG